MLRRPILWMALATVSALTDGVIRLSLGSKFGWITLVSGVLLLIGLTLAIHSELARRRTDRPQPPKGS